MALEVDGPLGSTKLDPIELGGLRLPHIQARAQLDEAEQLNIQAAALWLSRARPGDILSEKFLLALHKRMFSEVWKWAGAFRRTEKNIGCDPLQIPVRTRQLLDDLRYWLDHHTFPLDEIGARYHHRLVQIHLFANGNGRHGRLVVDDLLRRRGADPLTWGDGSRNPAVEVRARYIAALRAADANDIGPLLAFVRS